MANADHLYLERLGNGQYDLRWGNAKRASAITSTQGQGIARAQQIAPNAPLHIERQRTTKHGKPDQWRS
jgi:hypothetical protein